MANQYQTELANVIASGGDVEKFKKEWHERACKVYRERVHDQKSINDFRSGKFEI